MTVDLDAVRRLCEQASDGPWSWVDPGGRIKQALVSGHWHTRDGVMVLPSAVPDVYPSVADAAFIAAARELVPSLADEVERLRAELAALNDGPDEHVIDLRDDGWTIKHPLSCRPHLFDCPVNRAAERDLTEAPAQLGRFVCLLDEVGGFTIDTTPGGAR
jgi:hypothetical protein